MSEPSAPKGSIVGIYYAGYVPKNQSFIVRKLSKPETITMDDYNTHYVCVFRLVNQTVDPKNETSYLESVFNLFNNYALNPLVEIAHRDFLLKNSVPFSMSIGDIITIDGRYFVVMGQGFREM